MATVLNKPLAPPDPKPRTARPVVYPTSDGKPMAETDKHADIMVYCKEALRAHYEDAADRVYVSGNNFVYWQEGDKTKRISPDVYVVFGPAQRRRDAFMSWEEGGNLPSVVFEITSKKTRREDEIEKRALYQNVLRTPEYIQFDPTGDYLRPRLQGLTRVDDHYEPMPLVGGDRIYSPLLGLYLVIENEWLRFLNPRTGTALLSPAELAVQVRVETRRAEYEASRAQAEAARAEYEAARAQTAENEVAQLRAELERLRAATGDPRTEE